MSEPAPRTRNVRGRRAQARVLEAATRLFAGRGYNGVSIADIAAEAGIAKPSILYLYPDKDALWKAVVAALWTEVDGFYAEHWPRHLGCSRARVERLLDLFIEAGQRWPAYIQIPFIEGATPSWRTEWLVDRHFGRHIMAADADLRALQAEGRLPAGVDTAHLQALLTSGINVFIAQRAMWARTYGRDLGDTRVLKQLASFTTDLLFGPRATADDY